VNNKFVSETCLGGKIFYKGYTEVLYGKRNRVSAGLYRLNLCLQKATVNRTEIKRDQ